MVEMMMELIKEACFAALREMSPEEVKSLSFIQGSPLPPQN